MRRTDWTVNGDRLIIELSTYGDVVDVFKLKLEHLCVVKSCVTLELEIYAVGPGVRVRERCVCMCGGGGGGRIFCPHKRCVSLDQSAGLLAYRSVGQSCADTPASHAYMPKYSAMRNSQ